MHISKVTLTSDATSSLKIFLSEFLTELICASTQEINDEFINFLIRNKKFVTSNIKKKY